MKSLIYCAFILFSLSVVNAQQGWDYCNGSVTLRGLTGTIADHFGGGNYNEDVICVWYVQPASPVNSIRLVFDKFETEYGFDYVIVRNGPSTSSPVVAWFSGSIIPEPIEVIGSAMTVIFYSDQLLTGAGFEAVYYGSNCPNRCSGHGTCIQGNCVCSNGYSGTDCSSTYCYNNCNAPHGQCLNNTCVCEGGYYGVDCANPYCGGPSTFTSNSGLIQDHYGGGNYLNNQNCSWLIDPNAPCDSITLTFERFDTEQSYDFVRVENGWEADFIGLYSGTRVPPPAVASAGVMNVVFTTDEGITKTGFAASFQAYNCTNSCSNNGHCHAGICACHSGWGGEDCSQPVCSHGCHGHGNCVNNICQCNAGWSGLDCGICNGVECPVVYCYNLPQPGILTNVTGLITDHTGPGDYTPNTYCSWRIQPSNQESFTAIVLEFSDFDLDEGDWVAVYDGINIGAPMIAYYQDNDLPPPVISTAESMYVAFSSKADTGTGTGFVATYYTITCTQDCSENGICNLDGTCTCYLGYTGAYCEQTYCANNCSFNGECRDNMCHCDPGHFGPDCSDTYCGASILYEEPFGIVREHSEGYTYRSNSDCGFLIEVPTAPSISLVFTSFQTESLYDYVNVYDGPNNTSPLVINQASGSFLPHPVKSTSNSLFVEFVSDNSVEFTGFVAHYSNDALCPNACTNSGFCLNGTCFCYGGFTGADCSQPMVTDELTLGTTYNDVVIDRQWKYYKFTVGEDAAELLIKFNRVSNNGNPELYLEPNGYPTFNVWAVHSYSWGDGLQLRFPPQADYYFGVYGNSNQGFSNYTFSVTLSCPENCGNGVCQDGFCVCNYCWEGDVCDRNTCGGFSATVAALIAIVIIVGSAGVIGLFLYCIVKARSGSSASANLPAVEMSESASHTGGTSVDPTASSATTPRTEVTTPYASPRDVKLEETGKDGKGKQKGYKQFQDEV